jgi:hypothetical protein
MPMKLRIPGTVWRAACLAALGWLVVGGIVPAQAVVLTPEVLREAAVHYDQGNGVKQDSKRAYQLYCVAALEGDALAARRLVDIYLDGLGRAADSGIAAGWLRYAVQHDRASVVTVDTRLVGVQPAADPECPTAHGALDEETIDTWVTLFAREYGVDPELVTAVIAVESNFNPKAESPRGARGLMQLLPETAKRFEVRDIWDPIQNIRGGIAYLRWLIEHYNGRLRLVLAGYNAGEQAVEQYGRIPPYEETRHYVTRILIRYGLQHLILPINPLPIEELGPRFTEAALEQNLLFVSSP